MFQTTTRQIVLDRKHKSRIVMKLTSFYVRNRKQSIWHYRSTQQTRIARLLQQQIKHLLVKSYVLYILNVILRYDNNIRWIFCDFKVKNIPPLSIGNFYAYRREPSNRVKTFCLSRLCFAQILKSGKMIKASV